MTTQSRTLAARLLDRAAGIVDGDRRQQNGPPERSLKAIAASWEWYLHHRPGRPLDAADVATMLELLKIGRSICGEPLPDHFVDRAGYAALAGEAELLAKREGDARPNGHAEPVDQAAADDRPDPIAVVLQEVAAELQRATLKFPPMHSPHEGFSIVREEVDELWAEIKRKEPDCTAMRGEAIQLAAMVLRFVGDVCPAEATADGDGEQGEDHHEASSSALGRIIGELAQYADDDTDVEVALEYLEQAHARHLARREQREAAD